MLRSTALKIFLGGFGASLLALYYLWNEWKRDIEVWVLRTKDVPLEQALTSKPEPTGLLEILAIPIWGWATGSNGGEPPTWAFFAQAALWGWVALCLASLFFRGPAKTKAD